MTWGADGLASDDEFEIFGQRLAEPTPPSGAGGQPPQSAGKIAGTTATKTGSNRAEVITGTAKRDVIAALAGPAGTPLPAAPAGMRRGSSHVPTRSCIAPGA